MPRYNGGFIGTDGLDAPDPPTIDSVTAGDAQVSVAFTAPTDTGTSAITGFVAQVSTDGTNYSAGSNTGTSSPIVVTSLTNDTAATAKVWAINAYGTSAPSDASSSFTPAQLQRGLFAGGTNSSGVSKNVIEQIQIATTANATDFGDLSDSCTNGSGSGSDTRSVFSIGNTGSVVDTIEYVAIATAGNSADFGNLSLARDNTAGLSSATRAIFAGGQEGNGKTIDYITISSTGNATDFGDLTAGGVDPSGAGSTTKGLFFGSYTDSPENRIDVITIASTGNATQFGSLNTSSYQTGAVSSNTRAVVGGGVNSSGNEINEMGYVTIASAGNTTDFGDLTTARGFTRGVSSKVRGVFGGGFSGNVIDYITIASTGNATDFGDHTVAEKAQAVASSAHGGLS